MAHSNTFTLPGAYFGWGDLVKTMLSGQKFDLLEYGQNVSDTYGGFTKNTIAAFTLYLITDPEVAREILIEKNDQFVKDPIMKRTFVPFAGNGVLTSEGDFWKRQHKLIQPAFHHKRIMSYAETMVEHTLAHMKSWKEGETRQMDRDLMGMTLTIVNKTLLDADVSEETERIGEMVNKILEAANAGLNAIVAAPKWMPTPTRLHQKRIVAEFDMLIQRIIDERRKSGEDKGDLLSMLLQARDDDGQSMSDEQLLDEVRTLILAGHETTASTLTFAMYLLAAHPDVKERLQHELDTVLEGRAPTLADLPKLTYTDQIIKETLRLYPAAPGVTRAPIAPTEVGGAMIPAGATLQISIYAMHRSARYWENPHEFDPERFTPENEKRIPKGAYLPFSAGPRVCIGNQFALMEARLILATIVGKFDFELPANYQFKAEQLLTLRAKGGLPMVVRERHVVKEMQAVGD